MWDFKDNPTGLALLIWELGESNKTKFMQRRGLDEKGSQETELQHQATGGAGLAPQERSSFHPDFSPQNFMNTL